MMQLFRAWSVIDGYLGQDQVKFNWFVVGRSNPVVPYEELIENYDENRDEACYDQMLVNEFFTEAEVVELRDYLLISHEIELQVEEVLLPVRAGGLSYGLLLISGQSRFYTLADEEGYKLSISVLGHFDLEEEKSFNLLSYEDLQIGAKFLERVFTNLNISVLEQNELITLLNKIYKETGFYVQQIKKKSKSMNSITMNN
ncbi:MAG: hypothetical protein CVU90_04900 [Firmicutes bacterium HGW-Firmicutes-15]|nr:MAG: hypothetical protein CVU90_04900 [Firmicutes bacterium HGW-Firmicutes-15]